MKYILKGIVYAIFIGIATVTYLIKVIVLFIWNLNFKPIPTPSKHLDELSNFLDDLIEEDKYDSGY